MKVVGIIQARISSSRLPGKVLMPLAGTPVLRRVIDRLRTARTIDDVVVATSTGNDDDAIEAACLEWGIRCIRGPLDDVLTRTCMAIRETAATTVVRIPADKPFLDPAGIDALVTAHLNAGADYSTNMGPGWPGDASCAFGVEAEVASAAALLRAEKAPCTPSDREHVMPYLARATNGFVVLRVPAVNPFDPLWPRLNLDTAEDYSVISEIYDALATPDGTPIPLEQVRSFLMTRPEIVARNETIEQRGAT